MILGGNVAARELGSAQDTELCVTPVSFYSHHHVQHPLKHF